MIKKIALTSIILVTLANAEINPTGFFAGIDLSSKSTNIKYDNTGVAFSLNPYTAKPSQTSLSCKLGYQYYFTRLFAQVNSFEYKDTSRDKYTIRGTSYEINADYIPIFYVNKDTNFDIRGVFGFAMGFNSSKLENYDVNLLPVGLSADSSQKFMKYGYQVGVMIETSYGVSLETGLKFRQGNLLEFTDGQNEVTFFHNETEYYFGINYLF